MPAARGIRSGLRVDLSPLRPPTTWVSAKASEAPRPRTRPVGGARGSAPLPTPAPFLADAARCSSGARPHALGGVLPRLLGGRSPGVTPTSLAPPMAAIPQLALGTVAGGDEAASHSVNAAVDMSDVHGVRSGRAGAEDDGCDCGSRAATVGKSALPSESGDVGGKRDGRGGWAGRGRGGGAWDTSQRQAVDTSTASLMTQEPEDRGPGFAEQDTIRTRALAGRSRGGGAWAGAACPHRLASPLIRLAWPQNGSPGPTSWPSRRQRAPLRRD